MVSCTIFLLTGCSFFNTSNSSEQLKSEMIEVTKVENEELEVIADRLNIPWSIEKAGDLFYLSERTGGIAKIQNGEAEKQTVELEKELATASEAGLLGFVLSPDFEQSQRAYAYYTYVDESGQFNRIVTLHHEGNTWKEESLLLDKIPSGTRHHGGRIEIGPDEKLYATAGDAGDTTTPQDLNSLGGKILRMNLDGSIPADNPFPNSYIYSYGHRNPQGITWSSDGTMYASEHGNDANDEINVIEPGQNYGWPIIEGNEQKEGMVTPLFTSGPESTWAPSGLSYIDDKLYVAALRGQAVLEFDLQKKNEHEFVKGLGRIRDVFVDGPFLYLISNNTDGRGTPAENDDKLYRIRLSR
ncbi:PQQ-dependent sugar dehydrogenase [Ureibacillus sp. GCM10028918]|uniref:PQQ-dependent sugar dehydrogenase n=1 Tax=Ureibacillus sp. GCM10028918 TaxID=3273429 RepID=UPI00361B4E8A